MTTTPLAEYQARRSRETHERAAAAIRELVRKRHPVTFSSVAIAAGVSRGYLYRNQELAEVIRAERDQRPAVAPAPAAANSSIEAALRSHIRRLQAGYEQDIRGLREENAQLRRELQNALGELVARG